MREYTNSEVEHLIDERIHSDRDRQILKRRLIDGWTYEHIAEAFDLSPRHTKTIIYRAEDKLFR